MKSGVNGFSLDIQRAALLHARQQATFHTRARDMLDLTTLSS